MAREYIPKYIRSEAWKRITSVIRDYNQLKLEYEELQRDPANHSTVRAKELKRKITAFRVVFEKADGETQELIQQRFWNKKTYRDILVPMSESTMKRYIRRFVLEVGQNLGEVE